MDNQTITNLARATNALRPDWNTGSLRTFIVDRLSQKPNLEAAIPLLWVALDPETKTPGRCLQPGPWSAALRTTAEPPTPIPDPVAWAPPATEPTPEYHAARAQLHTMLHSGFKLPQDVT